MSFFVVYIRCLVHLKLIETTLVRYSSHASSGYTLHRLKVAKVSRSERQPFVGRHARPSLVGVTFFGEEIAVRPSAPLRFPANTSGAKKHNVAEKCARTLFLDGRLDKNEEISRRPTGILFPDVYILDSIPRGMERRVKYRVRAVLTWSMGDCEFRDELSLSEREIYAA